MDSRFTYTPDFISNPDQVFQDLMREIPFEQRQVRVFGKVYDEPRLTSIHGDDDVLHKEYIYSRSRRQLVAMTPTLVKLQAQIEEATGIHFDFVLLNLYRTGQDKVGWHSDDEPMMDCSHIASLSLGAERVFKFRNKSDHQVIFKERLRNGSMVHMKPGCQEELEHEVPKEAKVDQPRINLTFRRFR